MSEKKWFSTGYLKASPTGKVDPESGIIEGVKVCTEGEAKGHDVFLDADFVKEVVRLGNEKKQGIKARFGHPNMCSTALGTFLGRHKNFRLENTVREDGTKALTAVADLFLSNEAKDTPNGNLHAYVLGMAKNEPDQFGNSIVFSRGREYRKTANGDNAYITYQAGPDGKIIYDSDGRPIFSYIDKDGLPVDTKASPLSEELYVECAALHACDCVDDPAANDGLFSKFAGETVAGQITEFLDLHPQVWGALSDNPDILAAISRHADKLEEFVSRYRQYLTNQEDPPMKTDASSEQPAEAPAVQTEPATTPETATQESTTPAADPVEPQPPAAADPGPETPADSEPTVPMAAPPAEPVKPEPDTFDAGLFLRVVEKFGAGIAAETVRRKGDWSLAVELNAELIAMDNIVLRKKVEELSAAAGSGTAPVGVVALDGPAQPNRVRDMIKVK